VNCCIGIGPIATSSCSDELPISEMKNVVLHACAFLIFQIAGVSAAAWHGSLKSTFRGNHHSDKSRHRRQRKLSHDSLEFSFEITNYNYYDLTKSTCPTDLAATIESTQDHEGEFHEHDKEVGNAMDEIFKKTGTFEDILNSGMKAVDGAASNLEHGAKDVAAGVKKVGKKVGDGAKEMEHEVEEIAKPSQLLQRRSCASKRRRQSAVLPPSDDDDEEDKCDTVEEVFREAVEDVVAETIDCFFHHPEHLSHDEPMIAQFAPTPAMAPIGMQPIGFLQGAPAPAPTIAAISSSEELEIFVAFEPGHTTRTGKTIIVDVLVTDPVGFDICESKFLDEHQVQHCIDELLAPIVDLLEQAMHSAAFNEDMAVALEPVIGERPKLKSFGVKKKPIVLWNVTQCEGHLKSLVSRFARTYTRERVPSALYNECTNFITKMSFSHDYVLDKHDIAVCKETTIRFARHWDYAKNADDMDFKLMCVRACKGKFGKKSPRCRHQYAGSLSLAPTPALAMHSVR